MSPSRNHRRFYNRRSRLAAANNGSHRSEWNNNGQPRICTPLQQRTLYLTFWEGERHRGPVTREELLHFFTEMFGDGIVEEVKVDDQAEDGYPLHGYLTLTHRRHVPTVLNHEAPPRRLRTVPGNRSVWIKLHQNHSAI